MHQGSSPQRRDKTAVHSFPPLLICEETLLCQLLSPKEGGGWGGVTESKPAGTNPHCQQRAAIRTQRKQLTCLSLTCEEELHPEARCGPPGFMVQFGKNRRCADKKCNKKGGIDVTFEARVAPLRRFGGLM